MYPLALYARLLLLVGVLAHETEHPVNHFYCRVCGSIVVNSTSIVAKEAEGVYSKGKLEDQDGDEVIRYDSFDSSAGRCWNGVIL